MAGQEPGQHPYTVRGEVSATAAHILSKLTTSVLSSGLTRRSSPRRRRSEGSPRSRRLEKLNQKSIVPVEYTTGSGKKKKKYLKLLADEVADVLRYKPLS